MSILTRRRGRKSFRKEFKRQLKYAIAAGVGFLIAYAWKEAIWNSADELVEKFINSAKTTVSSISTSIIITIIGVIIILLTSRLLRDK